MADAPKKEEGSNHFEQVVAFLIGLAFLVMLWYRIESLTYFHTGAVPEQYWHIAVDYFYARIVPVWEVIALGLSLLAVWGLATNVGKLYGIQMEENALYGVKLDKAEEDLAPKNDKWERVIAHLNSANPGDWRLAVLEADIMLDELLKSAGYHGETMGERLKAVDRADFLTLDNAWEAHRVRNQVAHQGADFPLSEREAKRAIALYESVFKEFKII